MVLRITYGYEVKKEDDEMVALVNCAMEELSVASTPGQFLVDIIPMRMWLEKWFESALSAQTCCCIRDCWRFLMPCYTLRYTCAAARPMSSLFPYFYG